MSQTQQYSKSMNGLLDIEATSVLSDNIVCDTIAINSSGTVPTPLSISNDTTIPNTSWVKTELTTIGSNFVDLTTNQTITSGIKTFNSVPICSTNATTSTQLTNKATVDSAVSTAIATAVLLTGTQSVAGLKTFTTRPQVLGGLPVASSADLVNRGYTDLTYVSLSAAQTVAGIKTFSSLPVSTVIATTANQLTNKSYVDGAITTGTAGAVLLTTDQSIDGIKTFSSVPICSTNATTSSQLTNKSYVDGAITTGTANSVLLTTDQSIDGIKTFNSVPICSTNATTSSQLTNKSYVDGEVSTAIGTAVLLTGAQSVAGIKTFSSLPESTVIATTANQLTNKSYVDGAITTGTAGAVLLTTDQSISGIKTFNSVPICSTNATTSSQLTNKSYVDNAITTGTAESLSMGTTGKITGSTIQAYPPLVATVAFDPDSGRIGPAIAEFQIGTIVITGNDYDTITFNLSVNRQVYNAQSGTITFTGITGDTVKVMDQTNPLSPIFIGSSSVNISQTASLVFGAADTPVTTRPVFTFTVSGNSGTGKVYVIYWAATSVNVSSGLVGIRFQAPFSTITQTNNVASPASLSGSLVAYDARLNTLRCNASLTTDTLLTALNISCKQNPALGVIITNPGMTLMWPLNRSATNLATWTRQTLIVGTPAASEYQSGVPPAVPGDTAYSNTTSATGNTFYIVYPNWGIILYSLINYGGTVMASFRNRTETAILLNILGTKNSARVYYNNIQQN